jgi:protocatechuate 3,4-dioxygenase beta subunit
LSGIVRSDIRSSVGGATGLASGVPLTMKLVLVNTAGSCAALAGYAIYLWHCDAQGRYSMYSSGVTGENYLRGVQATDSAGMATFQTVFPGCYSGRMPHMHFEVYRSVTAATSYANKLRTSQLAFPNEVSSAVYASAGYPGSSSNLAATSFNSDGVFSDGVTLQMTTVTGSVAAGYVATLQVGISA